MEDQHEPSHGRSKVPDYDEWPSVPDRPPQINGHSEPSVAMTQGNTMSPKEHDIRSTSVLSMDDIEAAQALEGLRAGRLLVYILGFTRAKLSLQTSYKILEHARQMLYPQRPTLH